MKRSANEAEVGGGGQPQVVTDVMQPSDTELRSIHWINTTLEIVRFQA